MVIGSQRMYCIAMRHLSGIQKGIQSAHAIVEYANEFGNTKAYKQWASEDKTLIVLEANTTNMLSASVRKLKKLDVRVAEFKEPDLGNTTTAIAFLLDEKAYDTHAYSEAWSKVEPETLAIREIKDRFHLASN